MHRRQLTALALLAALAAAGCAHRGGWHGATTGTPVAALPCVVLEDLSGQPEEVRQLEAALPAAAAAATRWGRLPERLRIVIHADRAGLQAATGVDGDDAVLAWARDGVIDLQAPASWPGRPASAREVALILAHELTHLVLYQEVGPGDAWTLLDIPSWFREGMASVTAGERHAAPRPGGTGARDPHAAVQAGAHHAFLLLEARHGEAGVRRLLAALGRGTRFPEAFEAALGTPLAAFEQELEARRFL